MKLTAKQTDDVNPWYLLEDQQAFSQSLLWEIQQQYYGGKGFEVWQQDEVPYYVTNNPTIANSYAETVFAFLREQRRLARDAGQSDEPLYICELGAGSGRFAFYFLKRLTRLCEQAKMPPDSFCYVMTDFTQNNLDAWRLHPRFQTFFESGLLDVSLFDIKESDRLTLQLSGKTISDGNLNGPLVAIANYVLDSIPQDLFYIDEQCCDECFVTLIVDEDPVTLTTAELLRRLQYRYHYRLLNEPPYQESYLQQLLADYQRRLTDTHMLFPAAGLRCLQRLKALSKDGMLLLSADKGDHRLEAFEGGWPPILVGHTGCFSLSVNYHVYKAYCEQNGGIALFPSHYHKSLDVACLLIVSEPSGYLETQRAFQRNVQEFSPDDYFIIADQATRHVAEMSVGQVMAYLRFGHYDSYQFTNYLPRLMEVARELNSDERLAIGEAVDKVWDLYFPLGEELDLAHQIAYLLYEMDDYDRAITYFERSIEIYGEHAGTLFNMAVCYQLIGQSETAESLLHKVLRYDPDNQQAVALLAETTSKR